MMTSTFKYIPPRLCTRREGSQWKGQECGDGAGGCEIDVMAPCERTLEVLRSFKEWEGRVVCSEEWSADERCQCLCTERYRKGVMCSLSLAFACSLDCTRPLSLDVILLGPQTLI